MPFCLRIFTGVEGLVVVCNVVFVFDPLEPLKVSVVVVVEVRERFPDAVDRIVRLPRGLFDSQSLDRVSNRDEPTVFVVAAVVLLEDRLLCHSDFLC